MKFTTRFEYRRAKIVDLLNKKGVINDFSSPSIDSLAKDLEELSENLLAEGALDGESKVMLYLGLWIDSEFGLTKTGVKS